MAKQFVLVRQTKMKGVDLSVFDFDFDLTWMAFFLSPEQKILARYGGRDATSPEGRMSLAGLRYTMKRVLEMHLDNVTPASLTPEPAVRYAEQYSAARRLPPDACIHCHQVNELHRERLQALGKWDTSELWVYPLPENLGLSMHLDEADRVINVEQGSSIAKAGLRVGDRLTNVGGQAISSFGDLQYALHRASGTSLDVAWTRAGKEQHGEVVLPEGWRKTDLSWRWSLQYLEPTPWVYGEDLSVERKKELGLDADALAFRQGPFLRPPARHAGFQSGDIVVAIDGKVPARTFRQFEVYVKLNYRVGDKVTYQVIRKDERMDIALSLQARPRP